jgi:general nucleoside transport system ATP-binding protein
MSYIVFENIAKVFGPCVACQNVTFKVTRGHIHSIVGENGAGKSTLMNLLGGLYEPTTGAMTLNGSPYQPKSALDAYHHKIAYIHQHFVLAQQMTAFENILLSSSSHLSCLHLLPKKEIRKKAEELLKKFNWSIQFDEKVENISVGEQQRLEILKALLLDPDIFIFDEPTAVLTPQESNDLLEFLLQLKKDQKTILLISHKLNEIKKVSDDITVMRAGHSITTQNIKDLDVNQIAELMIGRKAQKQMNLASLNSEEKDILFQMPELNTALYKKEIFGVAGVEGNGQSDLIKKIISAFKKNNLSYGDISEDRLRFSVFPKMNLVEHILLKHSSELQKNGLLLKQKARALTEKIIHEWDVRPGLSQQNLDELSGGNQQKFMVGRELHHSPDVLLAAHPTRGVDIGSQEMIHKALIEFSQKNKSVFLVSSDLDEILALCDRFVILYKNKAFGPFTKSQLTETEIGQYMTGLAR